ncbi:hypothetical protein J25TS5_00660 [Paenibacillus faecis]|uniref:hypothetical protein n=1 Tax=Paenibacillus faecis TaxID=862114 RepID=UPI001B25B30E|nr:hypothetical protein [Paenibacillus faecis]GIO83134.1 hypothetical protein J25TS5_00660 [Paenibacillus faecis]
MKNRRVMGWKLAVCVLMFAAGTALSGPAKAEIKNKLNSETTPQTQKAISKKQVTQWIKQQGARKANYYFEGLTFIEVQLDEDKELEVIAGIDGGVHLGHFFVLDRTKAGTYKLIAEKDWKVEALHPGPAVETDSRVLYETVERTGGTGIDVKYAHLWYVKDGKWVEAWKGVLKERNAMITGAHSLVAGSYQVIDDTLFSWETLTRLEDDDETVKGERETTLQVFQFDGTRFVEKK